MELGVSSWIGGACRGKKHALPFFQPRVDLPLWTVFREDRALLSMTAILWIASLVPMGFTPILPFSDMGLNASMASLIWDTATGHGVAAEYYRVNWAPNPYWTSYAIMALVGLPLGPLVAAKVVCGISMLLIPLGVMRLLVTLGRSPRLGLWAFLLAYNHVLYAGWVSLLLGIGLCFFVIAWTLEARTVKDALRVAAYSAIVGVTHIQGIWFLMIVLPPLALFGAPLRRRVLVHAIALGGAGLTVLPWLFLRTGPNIGAAAAAFGFEWHSPEHKLENFFRYTLGTFVRPDGVRLATMALVVVLLGPLCLSLFPRVPARGKTAAPLVLLVAAGALYLLLPFSISGPISHWYTYPRFALVTLLCLLLVPAPRLDGRRVLALLPGVLLALELDLKVAEQFAAFGVQTKPLLRIIDQVKPEASVLPLVLDDADADPDLKLPPYHQLFAYITAFKKGYVGGFWEIPGWPIGYLPGRERPPHPSWDIKKQLAFTMDEYGKHYDYVVVQGFQHGDPLWPLQGGPLPHPKFLVESGRWRLYEIQR